MEGGGGEAGKEIWKVNLALEESGFCCFEERKRNEGKTDRAFRGFEGKVIPAAFRRQKPPVFIRAPYFSSPPSIFSSPISHNNPMISR